MCNDCFLSVCPPACPENQVAEFAACAICGEPITPDDGYYTRGKTHICAPCADCLTVDEIIGLGDLTDTGELLAMLGFRSN